MGKVIICIATPLYPPQIGGPATHVSLLEQGLSKEDFELRIVKFGSVSFLPKGLKHLVYFFCVLWQGMGATFIYTLDPVSVGLPALCAAKILRKKLVLRVGGDYAWEQGAQRFGVSETLDEFVHAKQKSRTVRFLQRIQSLVARRAQVVIAPSEYLKGIIQTWGVREGVINVIYSQPEVPVTPLSRADARKKLGIREDERIILSAGRLVPWKGYEGLLDATLLVREVIPVRLVIVGDGPHLETLEAYIEKKKATACISLLGQLPHSELQVWLAAADVFALNTKYEGLSHIILEAFAAKVPVVTTNVGGNVELVENGKTGLLVRPDDVDSLAKALEQVISNGSVAATLSEQAYLSLSRFNPTIALAALGTLFKQL